MGWTAAATPIRFGDKAQSPALNTVSNAINGFQSAWVSYTPVLTASTTNPTMGTGWVRNGRYHQMGKTVFADVYLSVGGAGFAAGSGQYYINLPVPAVVGSYAQRIGFGAMYYAAARCWDTIPILRSSTLLGLTGGVPGQAYTNFTNTTPEVLVANTVIHLSFCYGTV